MRKFSFVLIGCGRIAERHARQIIRLANFVAVCDIDKQKADDFAQKYGVKAYYHIESLLENESSVDVASICTPNGLHSFHTQLCLKKGLHVLCEKPLCIRYSDGLAMIERAKEQNKMLFVVKSSRYTPIIAALKNALLNGELGQIYSFQLNCVWNRPNTYYTDSWKGTLDLDGGTLFTQFSHYIDVLLWLLGDVEDLCGFRNRYTQKNIEFEDSGALALKMKSGVTGTLHYSVNAYQKNQEVSLTLVAEKATIKLGGAYMNEVMYQNPQIIPIDSLPPGNESNDYGLYQGSMSNHDKVYENIIEALKGNENTVTDGESALKTVALIEKIYQQIPL